MIGTWYLSDLIEPLNAQLLQSDVQFTHLSIDGRRINSGGLFLALKGENFDGHDFVQQAVAQGSVALVVERQLDVPLPQLIVADSRLALGQIAKLNRERFQAPVIAVTGSAGKTTVKEMLTFILAQEAEVLATEGNLNNDIGAPLTLLCLAEQHQYAVIELGASAEQEIAYSVALTQPQVSILTNAMSAHLEGFGSLEAIVRAKGEIFNDLTTEHTAVINLDDVHASVWLEQTKAAQMTFAVDNELAKVQAKKLKVSNQGCYAFELHYQAQTELVQLNVLGRHNVQNALAASAALLAIGLPLSQIAKSLAKFNAVAGRMQPKTGIAGAQIIDDSYNASPEAVKAAIDLLVSIPGKKFLVLGDMAELGSASEKVHGDIGAYAAEQGCNLFATGQYGRTVVTSCQSINSELCSEYFSSKSALVTALTAILDKDTTVLVKGSRSSAMEEVVANLIKETS